MVRIRVLETGGTINGILDPAAPPPAASRVIAWLRQHARRLQLQVESQVIAMKDSRAIDATDRERLRLAIETAPERLILVPHGTYTMPETGLYLRQHLGAVSLEKSIVLVGSMIPLGEPGSDAPAALEFAIARLLEQPAGVRIAMNGRLWHPGEVVKDPVSGQYVARSNQGY
jgi:L-asparaginase